MGGGGLGGGLGADLGGDLGADLEEPMATGPEEMPAVSPDASAAGDAPAGEDSTLLAVPPGSRDGDIRTYEKSSYKAVKPSADGRKKSGFRKSQLAKTNFEKRGRANRAKFPGSQNMFTDTIPDPGNGLYEQQEPIYSLNEEIEEQKLFEVNNSIIQLIEGLDSDFNKKLMENKNED